MGCACLPRLRDPTGGPPPTLSRIVSLANRCRVGEAAASRCWPRAARFGWTWHGLLRAFVARGLARAGAKQASASWRPSWLAALGRGPFRIAARHAGADVLLDAVLGEGVAKAV